MEKTNLSNETENLRQESFDDEIELRRLARSISLAEKYFLYFASCNQLPKQKELIKKLKAQLKGKKITVIEFKEPIKNLLSELRKRLKTKKNGCGYYHGFRKFHRKR